LQFVEGQQALLATDSDAADRERDIQDAMQNEARDRIQALADQRRAERRSADDADDYDDDEEDDDHDVEVVYRP
jgi:GTP-binding protein